VVAVGGLPPPSLSVAVGLGAMGTVVLLVLSQAASSTNPANPSPASARRKDT
jgi:hypothetical protein